MINFDEYTNENKKEHTLKNDMSSSIYTTI